MCLALVVLLFWLGNFGFWWCGFRGVDLGVFRGVILGFCRFRGNFSTDRG